MALRIVPHSSEMTPLMLRFNERLRAGGSEWGFYVNPIPEWLPRGEDAPPDAASNTDVQQSAWREFFVVLDDTENEIRGAYCLKPQLFRVDREDRWLASWQGPVSEGIVDRRHAHVGMLCVRDMLARNQMQFGLGNSEPLVKFLEQLGWRELKTPTLMRVLRPRRFLREAAHFRRSRRNRMLLDTLAWSGIGSLALPVLHAGQGLVAGRIPRARAEQVDRFADWADAVWEQARDAYTMIAYRDAASLNNLMAGPGWPEAEFIRVFRHDDPEETIGWAALRITVMQNDNRFGNMVVGSVLDSLATPGEEAAVIGAALTHFRGRGVDLLFTTYTSTRWRKAFRKAGFIEMTKSRSMLVSPQLDASLRLDDAETIGQLHLTPIDGDGPMGL